MRAEKQRQGACQVPGGCGRLALLIALGAALQASPARADLIWDNGPLNTSGVALSIGWNQSVATPYRYALTDDFVITAPAVLSKLTTYGFMQGNSVNQPQVVVMYVRILADNNGQPDQSIFGGFATGIPFTETYTGSHYAGQASAPIYKLEAALPDWRLCSGRYWVQYNVDQSDVRPSSGNPDANYFSTLVAPAPLSPTGWHYSVIQNQYFSLQNNGPPFVIEGQLLPACAAPGDFDGDGECTSADVQGFVAATLSGEFHACADANGDCRVDGRDVQAFLTLLK